MVLSQRRMPIEFLASATLVFATAIWICNTQLSGAADDVWVAVGVTLDLAILVPALYYFFAVRKCGWPAFSTLPVFGVCLFAASKIVPDRHHAVLNGLHFVLPVAEMALVVAVMIAVRRLLVAEGPGDWLETAQGTLERWTGSPRVAKIVVFEMGLFRYAFARQKPAALEPGEFSYHQRTPLHAYMSILMVVIVVETLALHLLLSRWSDTVAWVITALSIYSALWLIGDTRAMSRRPIQVDTQALHLRFGMRWSLDVPWSEVERVETGPGVKAETDDSLEMVPLGAGANTRVILREPRIAEGPYGFTRSCSEVLLFVDEPNELVAAISKRSP